MFDKDLPDFPFPHIIYEDGWARYSSDDTIIYNDSGSYKHIHSDELHEATEGNWGIIPEGIRLESRVSVEFLYIIGRGI